MHLFVYGTLKRGYGNNSLLKGAKFLGTDKTYPMYDIFPCSEMGGYPILKEGIFSIKGEVFDVSNEILARCDKLEGHPNFYERRGVSLMSGKRAFLYFWKLKLQYEPRPMMPQIVTLGNVKYWQDIHRFKPSEFIP